MLKGYQKFVYLSYAGVIFFFKVIYGKKVAQAFLEELEIAVARRILSKSELSEEKAKEIGEEVKEGIARRHGL